MFLILLAVDGRNLALREFSVGANHFVRFILGAVQHFQQIGIPARDIHVTVQFLDQFFDGIHIGKAEFIDLVVSHHQLFLLHIGQPDHHITVAGFPTHAEQGFVQTVAGNDFAILGNDQRLHLTEHLNAADVLGDLLVGVPADVVGRLMQLCQLLYRDVHRAASFLSETRSRTMENRTAATTT